MIKTLTFYSNEWINFHRSVEKELGSYDTYTEPGYSFLRDCFEKGRTRNESINLFRRKYFND